MTNHQILTQKFNRNKKYLKKLQGENQEKQRIYQIVKHKKL